MSRKMALPIALLLMATCTATCFAQAEESFSRLASASHTAAAWTAQGDLALRRGDEPEARERFRKAALALHEPDLEWREVI